MNNFGLAMGACALFLFAAWGWGQFLQGFCRIPLLRLSSFATVTGLALFSAMGGVLNWAGQAKIGPIAVMILAGALIGIHALGRSARWKCLTRWAAPRLRQGSGKAKDTFFTALPAALAFLGGISACACLVPTNTFNFHDDFQTYMPRVARMLQTGSCGGNPFDGMGLDGLGGQTFLQGYFLLTGDVRFSNGFDAVSCFFLALWMTAQCAWRGRLPVLAGVVAVATVAVINPQHVNISPLYSSMVVIMAIVLWGEAFARQVLSQGRCRWGLEVVGALLIALLVTLKVTVALFAGIYLAGLFLLLFTQVPLSRFWRSALVTSGGAALVVLPWMLTHGTTIQRARQIANELQREGLVAADNFSMSAKAIPDLFSLGPLFYGDSLPGYHVVVLTALLGVVLAAALWWKRKKALPSLMAIIAAGFAVPGVYIINAHFFAVENSVRYSIPVLVGCFVMVLLLLDVELRKLFRWLEKRAVTLGVVAMLAVMGIFATTFRDRMRLALRAGSVIAFPLNQANLDYCQQAVSPQERRMVIDQQGKLLPGESTFVAVATPFHLNFARNEMMFLSDPGLINPALHLPTGCSAETFMRFLRKWGVRYVMLDVSGPAIKDIPALEEQAQSDDAISKKLSERGIFLRRTLEVLARHCQIVHSDPRTILFDLASARMAPLPNGAPEPAP